MKDVKDLKKDFENFNPKDAFCSDGSCESDEAVDLKDYPSYTDALYAKIIAPSVSGIYISRWDIKDIALVAGESMAIHPRKRMFELVMKFATTKENMQSFLDALENHIESKVDIYRELVEQFPSSADIFNLKIEKAENTMRAFPVIIDEYFE